MILQRPETDAPSSRYADWLELLAISKPHQAIGKSELQKVIRFEEEQRTQKLRYDEVSGEHEEGEIVEVKNEELTRRVFTEIQRRHESLKENYPFSVETVGRGINLRNRIRWSKDCLKSPGAIAYLCCLIVSARRLTLVELDDNDAKKKQSDGKKTHSEHRYGLLLQICAAIALGGYLNGDVVWFGYPRPDETNFLDAHRKAWHRFGAYKPTGSVPTGAKVNTKDGGVDLIGWINFSDPHGSKALVIGQVASGADWDVKAVLDYAHALKSWFDGPSFNYFLPAMVIPFNITDAQKAIQRGPDDIRDAVLEVVERQFGIVLDRDRVASCAALALNRDDTSKKRVDGIGQFQEVQSWVEDAIADLAETS